VSQTLELLIDQARSGDTEPFNQLVAALRADGGVPVAVLVDYARSPEEFLRRAAIAAAKGRTELELLQALEDLVHDPAGIVRYCLAFAIEETPLWPLDTAVEKLLYDEDSDVRLVAARAARWRPALEATLLARLTQDDGWRVRQAIAQVLAHFTPRTVLPALVAALGCDSDSDVKGPAPPRSKSTWPRYKDIRPTSAGRRMGSWKQPNGESPGSRVIIRPSTPGSTIGSPMMSISINSAHSARC
jgi:hypothetical protein